MEQSIRLELDVRGMTLHIRGMRGPVMDPLVPTKEPKEAITVTPDEIIHHRRLRVLDHAGKCGNVAETCRVFGISRTTFYRWQTRAKAYGLDALMPKERRRPQLPNATPT